MPTDRQEQARLIGVGVGRTGLKGEDCSPRHGVSILAGPIWGEGLQRALLMRWARGKLVKKADEGASLVAQ